MSYPTDLSHENHWRDNPTWDRLLGLSPLLVVATSTVNALGLAISAIGVLVTANIGFAFIRRFIPDTVRLPASMLVIGLCTSTAALLMQAFAFDLYERIAVFMQILVTNYLVLARAQAVANKRPIRPVLLDCITTGVGISVALLLVATIREILGRGLLLAALPPGAFLVAGLLLAAINALGRGR